MFPWIKPALAVAALVVILGLVWKVYDTGYRLAQAETLVAQKNAEIKQRVAAAAKAAIAAQKDQDAARDQRIRDEEIQRLGEGVVSEKAKTARVVCVDRDNTGRLRDFFERTGAGIPADTQARSAK